MIETPLEELVRPLAFVGLMIGSVLYLMLIRRRRSERDEVRARDASLRRGMARFVQLERQEDTTNPLGPDR